MGRLQNHAHGQHRAVTVAGPSSSMYVPGSKGGPATQCRSIDSAINTIGMGWFQAPIVLLAMLVGFSDAIEIMVLAIVGPAIRCDWGLTEVEEALLGAVVASGQFAGSLVWGTYADYRGRRPALILAAVVVVTSGAASAMAPSYVALLACRAMTGVGLAGAVVSNTMAMELCPQNWRGACQSSTAMSWAVGVIAFAVVADVIATNLPQEGVVLAGFAFRQWRLMFALSVFPGALVCLLAASRRFLPESPRFLHAAGRTAQAEQALLAAAGRNGKRITVDFERITVGGPGGGGGGPGAGAGVGFGSKEWSIFSLGAGHSDWGWKNLGCLGVAWFVSHLTYYGTVYMAAQYAARGGQGHCSAAGLGGGTMAAAAAAAVPGGCQGLHAHDYYQLAIESTGELVAAMLSWGLIDRLGRRPTFTAASIGFCVGGAILCTCPSPEFAGLLATTVGMSSSTAGIFVMRCAAFLGKLVLWVYTMEYLPSTHRSTGIGLCSAVSRIGMMIAPFAADVATAILSFEIVTTIFCATQLLGALALLVLPYDTLGRDLVASVDEHCSAEIASKQMTVSGTSLRDDISHLASGYPKGPAALGYGGVDWRIGGLDSFTSVGTAKTSRGGGGGVGLLGTPGGGQAGGMQAAAADDYGGGGGSTVDDPMDGWAQSAAAMAETGSRLNPYRPQASSRSGGAYSFTL